MYNHDVKPENLLITDAGEALLLANYFRFADDSDPADDVELLLWLDSYCTQENLFACISPHLLQVY